MLLPLEAMGPLRLPGTTPTRRERARGMDPEQIGARNVALVENPSAVAGVACEIFCRTRTAVTGGEVK